MADDDGVIGDDQLFDGMNLSVRLRRDFSVTDARQLLAAARRIYQGLNPGASDEDAYGMVSCAADALFVILENAGLLGEVADNQLAAYASDGLEIGGWRAEVVPNEPWPLSRAPRQDCLRGDVFALPPDASQTDS
jgi:hypothetical protein